MDAWAIAVTVAFGATFCVLALASAWLWGRVWLIATITALGISLFGMFGQDIANATGRSLWVSVFAMLSIFGGFLYLIGVGHVTGTPIGEAIHRTGDAFVRFITEQKAPTPFAVAIRWLGPLVLLFVVMLAALVGWNKWSQ